MAGRTGRYNLLTRIAAGGMGEVYLAADTVGPPPGRRVALKLLLPHLSDEREFIDMFLDEARLSARLHHPHIPQVLDVGLADGRYYLAIELIEGVSASQLLRGCRRAGAMLPLPVVRLVAQGLCEALDYAHELKGPDGRPLEVVHRDISPSNLLVSCAGQVLLNDFGIARARGRSHATKTGEVKGKFAYMPPEQLDLSAPVDRRADVYSAALTLYELATLESPFLRDTEPATIDAVRGGRLPDATVVRADVSSSFSAALARATSRRPEDRFESASALLQELLDGEVAKPEELGRLVESLCAEELGVFRRPATEPPTRLSVETSSMLPSGHHVQDDGTAVALAAIRSPAWRRVLPLGLAGALLGGVIAWQVREHGRPAPPPEASAPAVRVDPPAPPPPAISEPEKPVAPKEAPPVSEVRRPKGPAQPPKGSAPAPALARPPVPASSPAPGPGWLSLDASPWADVYIDGREIDRTPIARYPLPPGRYRVVFKNPERGRETAREVTVESGKPTSVLVDLK